MFNCEIIWIFCSKNILRSNLHHFVTTSFLSSYPYLTSV